MKKFFFLLAIIPLIFSCNEKSGTETTSSSSADSTDATALYEKNLATLKAGLSSIEKEDLDAWASNVADSVVFGSPAYGDTLTTKAHWKEFISFFTANFDSIKLTNPIFLPGIDATTHQPDGSARFYGTWTAVHSSGARMAFNFYGTFDFNKDNKIISANEFFDVGGVMNSIPKK